MSQSIRWEVVEWF